jgi:CRISPR type IV-associated protein Csf2
MSNNERNTYTFTGTITPAQGSPLAAAPMKPDRELHSAEKYLQGNKDTARLPRMLVSQDGANVFTAYFSGKSIRGKFRRMARNATYDILKEAGFDGWDVESHRNLTIGGVKGSGKEPNLGIAKMNALREEIPLQSVFGQSEGFGSSWIAGKLMIGMASPLIPLQAPDIVTGVRTNELRNNPDEARFLSIEEFERLDEITEMESRYTRLKRQLKDFNDEKKAAARKKDKDLVASLDADISKLEKEMEEAVKLIGSDNSVQMPLAGYECIAPGTVLNHKMVLRNASLQEYGVLVSALEQFSMDTVLGAHAADGCGMVECKWDVAINGKKAGSIAVKPFESLVIEDGSFAKLSEKAKKAFAETVLSSRLAKAG